MYGDVEIAKLRQEIADLRALVETRPVPPHARQHEITGEDTVRPTVYNNGTLLARHRALNFSTGLTATVDNANKRINVAAAGVTDHGELDGLTDDDHAQYLDETRHDALDHTGLTGVPTQYTDEHAQDAVGVAIAAGTQTGIAVTYDDATGKLNFDAQTAGDARYAQIPTWTNWTPTIHQSGADPSCTVTLARYCIVGKLCFIEGILAVTGAGNAGAIEIRGVPAAVQAARTTVPVGQVWVTDAAPSTIHYVGAMYFNTSTAFRAVADGNAGGIGTVPSWALANGDTIRFSGCYEIA
jgi:hypothetical protein